MSTTVNDEEIIQSCLLIHSYLSPLPVGQHNFIRLMSALNKLDFIDYRSLERSTKIAYSAIHGTIDKLERNKIVRVNRTMKTHYVSLNHDELRLLAAKAKQTKELQAGEKIDKNVDEIRQRLLVELDPKKKFWTPKHEALQMTWYMNVDEPWVTFSSTIIWACRLHELSKIKWSDKPRRYIAPEEECYYDTIEEMLGAANNIFYSHVYKTGNFPGNWDELNLFTFVHTQFIHNTRTAIATFADKNYLPSDEEVRLFLDPLNDIDLINREPKY